MPPRSRTPPRRAVRLSLPGSAHPRTEVSRPGQAPLRHDTCAWLVLGAVRSRRYRSARAAGQQREQPGPEAARHPPGKSCRRARGPDRAASLLDVAEGNRLAGAQSRRVHASRIRVYAGRHVERDDARPVRRFVDRLQHAARSASIGRARPMPSKPSTTTSHHANASTNAAPAAPRSVLVMPGGSTGEGALRR